MKLFGAPGKSIEILIRCHIKSGMSTAGRLKNARSHCESRVDNKNYTHAHANVARKTQKRN